MRRHKMLVGLAVAITAAGAGTALAATTPAPKRVTVSTPASNSYKINRFSKFNLRWNKDVYAIKSGGTLVFKNLQSDEPHTFSVMKRSQLPRTTRQIDTCGAQPPALPKYKPCRVLVKAHAPDAHGNPKNPVLNKGKAGIDTAGDSIVIPPKGAGPQPKVKVSAKRGTKLHFVCLVHPWMQAEVDVK